MSEAASTSFELRYDDEMVKMNESGLFSLPESTSPILVVDLQKADISEQEGQRVKEFKVVDSKRVQLHRAEFGVHSLIRIFFDELENGNALLEIVVHAGTIKLPKLDPLAMFSDSTSEDMVRIDFCICARHYLTCP